MIDHEFPQVPQLEAALRAAHRAFEGIAVPGNFVPEDEIPELTEVIAQLPALIDAGERAVAGQVGPIVCWEAPRRSETWDLVVASVDFEDRVDEFGGIVVGESAFNGPAEEWADSAFDRAARAYSREAGWDFAPDETGLWVVMLAPLRGIGGEEGEPWNYTGHLIGFVIVQDRDKDDVYESVAHIWTASAWRRRGIAQRLLAEARARVPITGVEGPYTSDGEALLLTCDGPGSGGGPPDEEPAAGS